MAAGKTTVGRRLARTLGWEFIDSDSEIVQSAGCSIAAIFEEEGEAAFRDREVACIRRLVRRRRTVLALGGGALVREENRRRVLTLTHVVYLRCSEATLAGRLPDGDDDTRPLLRDGRFPRELLAARRPLYEQAHTIIDADHGSPDEIVGRILEAWRDGEGGS